MKILIVDDEYHCRENLTVLIEKNCPEIKEIRATNSADSAYEIIKDYKPNILFLDVEMPDKNGFQLLQMINDFDMAIIFVTAHDEYALQSIKCGPTGYLLKPVDINELIYSIKQSIIFLAAKSNDNSEYQEALRDLTSSLKHQQPVKKICLSHSKKLQVINLDDIIFLSSDSYYTTFHLVDGQKIVMTKTLKFYQEALGPRFIRAHRSYLANVQHIEGLIYEENKIILINGHQIEISRRKSNAVVKKIKQIS